MSQVSKWMTINGGHFLLPVVDENEADEREEGEEEGVKI